MSDELIRFRISSALLAVAPATTLAVNPWTNFDPISVVKMSVLSTFSFLILALMIYSRNSILKGMDKKIVYLSILFIFSMLATLSFSGAPISQQFWGMFGRNTGFLSYLSLLIVFIGACVVCETYFYLKVVNTLIATAIPMTAYCLIQMSGNDPIGWSLQQTFGTLGNINFLSAFLGLVVVACLAMSFGNSTRLAKKIMLIFLAVIDFYIAASTGSIQGVLIAIAGATFIIFIWMGRFKSHKLFRIFYFILVTIMAFFGALGLANKGPLSKLLFQESNILRTDYWHAGWQMTLDHPIFGVGMDSYGDWYREARGQISTLRGSPDRTANTAHNIFLDISSNGGILLLLIYLMLLLFSVRAIYRLFRRSSKYYDSTFAALSGVWIAYQVQAMVSINQLGVGIWGWLFSGALIGYESCTRDASTSNIGQSRRKLAAKNRGKLLPAAAGIISILGFAVGFSLSFPALYADSKHFSALKSGSIPNLISASKLIGTTPFHMSQVIQKSISANLQSEAREVNEMLITKFPRDYFGWVARYELPTTTPTERVDAQKQLKRLDPFNPTIPQG